jgi:hypothetical protein
MRLGRSAYQSSIHRWRSLLRLRRDRPHRRAAEQRDELPSLHSITSSARAIRVRNTAKSRTARHDMKLCALTARQTHREDRALARLAGYRHIATHHARELARDGEPKPTGGLPASSTT